MAALRETFNMGQDIYRHRAKRHSPPVDSWWQALEPDLGQCCKTAWKEGWLPVDIPSSPKN